MIAADTPEGTRVFYLKRAGRSSWYEPGVLRFHGKNDFAFVRYDGTESAVATRLADLYLETDLPGGAQLRDRNRWYVFGDTENAE